ncbi:ABC transporter substrate-binding protein [Spirochaeta cellobiosiphila]|uniref:ABC transporter substrate-binding protein n=1 Tax=Spirochaeta cellobiosiphila TaxID=504483 RepID=UPI00040379E5|nr:sugar ABC transporter substrate-binding protein [Spirochaeta cellobiosiphila]
MIKKLLMILFLSTLSFGLFAEGQSESESSLLVWLPPFATGDTTDQMFWQETIAPWAEAHNVKVDVEITPWGGYEEKYLTGIASGQGPDIGYMYLEMFNDFIEMGTLEDLSGYFTEAEKAKYLYWDQGNMKGGQYALPFIVGNARLPYFNKEIFRKAGITELPQTWDDLRAAAVKIKNAGLDDVIPFGQAWADPAIGALNTLYYPYLWQAGGDIYNKAGDRVALMDNDAAVRAARFLYDMRYKYGVIPEESFSMDESTLYQEFSKGRVGIAYMDAKAGSRLTKAGVEWDFIPSFTDKTKAIWVASDSLIMNSQSKNKELAAELMKFITSSEVMAKYHTVIAQFPPITVDEAYNDNPIFEDMYSNDTEYFKTLPVAEGSFKIMDNLYKNLQLMMLDALTPEEAIKNTVDYSKSIIDSE